MTALGTNSSDVLEPADDNIISTPLKSNLSKSCTSNSLSSPKLILVPADLEEATANIDLIGKSLVSSMFRIQQIVNGFICL